MKHDHEVGQHSKSVREPVQVYLDAADRERLDRLVAALSTTKSDALRRGLAALEHELTDPGHHPALRIIGLAGQVDLPEEGEGDVAREHDRYLAGLEDRRVTGGDAGGC